MWVIPQLGAAAPTPSPVKGVLPMYKIKLSLKLLLDT